MMPFRYINYNFISYLRVFGLKIYVYFYTVIYSSLKSKEQNQIALTLYLVKSFFLVNFLNIQSSFYSTNSILLYKYLEIYCRWRKILKEIFVKRKDLASKRWQPMVLVYSELSVRKTYNFIFLSINTV